MTTRTDQRWRNPTPEEIERGFESHPENPGMILLEEKIVEVPEEEVKINVELSPEQFEKLQALLNNQ